eukprot:TRINITY_DN9572_c0_g1_i1.p1 TRINITY_DN9572_c0_g1~~TRINITY_DN9572_c0_g1_i1.p1  ORF type:complete len:464 (-),score=74.97 TRINITY_DN9572_c0_g1_i1:84-1475(-)
MPRELITVQVGQCGNQIGLRFWDLVLREHARHNKDSVFDESMSSFFRNVEIKRGNPINIPVGDGRNSLQNLKARAVIVDMEEGVINQMLKSELGELFDQKHFIKDVSGAGNNWAHGFNYYGPKYEETLMENFRKTVEDCDSLQGFFMMHSLGGGTGSGVGSYILGLLKEAYPEVYRFTTSIFPSNDDDVITSPYNSILSLNELRKQADCVLPVDNQALLNIIQTIQAPLAGKGAGITEGKTKEEKPFDKMNNIIAHLLANITCSMRFEGPLNVDLNEITMNLVPYPDQHFLLASMAPLYSLLDLKLQARGVDQMFKDILTDQHQLLCVSPLRHRYTALGLIIRGDVAFTDVAKNIKKIKSDIDMIYWNKEGFKYGLCNLPSLGQPYSALCLSNNTGVRSVFSSLQGRFDKLYRRKAHLHHYTEYIEVSLFEEASTSTSDLIAQYLELENVKEPSFIPRLLPLI